MKKQAPSGKSGRSRAAPFAALGAAFAAIALTVRPWRLDFPLDDDWAYLLATKGFVETGRLRLTDWAPASQVFHIAWGALWSKLFGWNMGSLKISTFLWFVAGAALLLQLLLDEGVGEYAALLGALTLVFNPIALVWSVSYMTDIPYLALLIASCWAYTRGARAGDLGWLFAGSLAVAAATLVRQTGLLIAPAAALALWRVRKLGVREAAAILAAPAAAYAGYALWFRFVHGPTVVSRHYLAGATLARLADPVQFISDAGFKLAAGFGYLGLFLAPLLAARRGGKTTFLGGALAACFLAAAAVLAVQRGAWPYFENTLERRGLGTLTISAPSFKPAGPLGFPMFWVAVTAAAALAGAALAGALPSLLSDGPKPAASLLAWVGVFQFAGSLLGAKYFDRYLLPLLPSGIALLSFSAARRGVSLKTGFTALAFMAALSIAGAADYAGWNSAKWELGRRAVSEGHDPGRIAGGFDWDGWWTYEDQMARLKSLKPLSSIGEWEWHTLEGHDEFLTFNPSEPPPLVRVDSAAYFSPLAMREGRVYLYRLEGAP